MNATYSINASERGLNTKPAIIKEERWPSSTW